MSENNYNEKEINNQTECDFSGDVDRETENKAKKDKKLTVHDVFLAIFYAIIIAVGISLCVVRGLNATNMHLFAVTVSVVGVFVLKLLKYRGQLKAHIADISFAGIMSVLALFATVTRFIG